jgi:hypothetical protein
MQEQEKIMKALEGLKVLDLSRVLGGPWAAPGLPLLHHAAGFFVGVPLALVAIVVWVYRPSAKRRYQADGAIPFDEK